MLKEENKRLHRRFFEEVVNTRNLALLDELFAPDYHEANEANHVQKREDVRQFLCSLLAAFPDAKIDVDYQMAEMDRVVSCIALRGTQMAQFQGIPPLGQRVLFPFVEVARYSNKHCVERWGGLNALNVMRQIEASRTMPSPSYPLAYTDRWAMQYRQAVHP